MSPRKHIFLHCADEKRRSVLAFVIGTSGYRVLSSPVILADVALFVDDPLTNPGETAFELPEDLPLLVMIAPERRAFKNSYPSHAFFVHDKLSAIELLEWIRIKAGRKRGPKKGFGRNKFSAQPQEATA